MKINAMLSYGAEEFVQEEILLGEIDCDEVLVKIKAVGICHTDIASTKSIYPFTYPVVLGHEGAGVVERVGSDVKHIIPGDHVVLIYSFCNSCENCLAGKPYICDEFYRLNTTGYSKSHTKKRLTLKNGEEVSNFFGQSSFAEYSIVSQQSLVKIDKDVPLEYLGPLACGIMTGFGSVIEKLKPNGGDSIAVFGCGAVGLSAIIASKIIGCAEIIAIDVNDSKLEFAKKFGATKTINSLKQNLIQEVQNIVSKGVHHVVESTGNPTIIQNALDITRLSGKVVVLSAVKKGLEVSVDFKSIQSERTLMGTIMGSVNPHTFIPRLIDWYKQGKLPLEELITFYKLEEINEAVNDLNEGKIVKAVLTI
ncbi:NAD(P)-dependent alcohol dehydrogenase [Solibacillus sp. FSL W8-0474]|uniref:NAD(P)-dependent alcohol dehydrogenase n=1 Tax=Solibacillus sp. FSL W8-0474 TaxID=2975336 RepID=UPI0030FB0EEC